MYVCLLTLKCYVFLLLSGIARLTPKHPNPQQNNWLGGGGSVRKEPVIHLFLSLAGCHQEIWT